MTENQRKLLLCSESVHCHRDHLSDILAAVDIDVQFVNTDVISVAAYDRADLLLLSWHEISNSSPEVVAIEYVQGKLSPFKSRAIPVIICGLADVGMIEALLNTGLIADSEATTLSENLAARCVVLLSQLELQAWQAKQIERQRALIKKIETENDQQLTQAHTLFIGESTAATRLRKSISHCQHEFESRPHVILFGRRGSGHEIIARALHNQTPSENDPLFVKFEPRQLFRDSATGDKLELVNARAEAEALSEMISSLGSDGSGTLFIEDFSILSSSSQELVLRLFSGRESTPARLMIGTEIENANLRLNDVLTRPSCSVTSIVIPSLQSRYEDIPAMAQHYVTHMARKSGKFIQGLTSKSHEALVTYHWPGEFAQFQRVLKSAVVGTHNSMVELDSQTFELENPRIGQYLLKRKIGEGGMGEVWLAEHEFLGRKVAIKLVKSSKMSEKVEWSVLLSRFDREARITANLESNNTVRLFDFGISEAGHFYCVMEYLRGIDLYNLVCGYGPISPNRLVYFLKQACHSLEESHAQKLIHRDIKPANLFICRKGFECDILKVLDFGIVKTPDAPDQQLLTQEGLLVGTPEFMAPEYIGEGQLDGRSDLYSLGCVAYWALTERYVFDGETDMAILLKHLEEKPTSIREFNPNVPVELEEVIFSCLAKSPDDRPASAYELYQTLNRLKIGPEWNDDHAYSWWNNNQLFERF